MKRKLLYLLSLIVIITTCLFLSLAISDGGLFLKMDLTTEYSLKKELFANKYNLVLKSSNEIAVENIGDWIIADQYIFGHYRSINKYFLLKRKSTEVETFPTMHDLSLRLKFLGLSPYDMSNEESFIHLKYHKRIYPIKDK